MNLTFPLQWNKQVVYDEHAQDKEGWSRRKVDLNIFALATGCRLRHGFFDPDSNAVPYSKEVDLQWSGTKMNYELSKEDKICIAKAYP
ncbi:hypothetical protein PV05_10508 [Exophiala xenobiotica]|uniref:Uncharacterized protein n=1 Tax=Exophiala xenobiotica TaxID=348802 RepID=A0A0D2CPC8_9EURO|nr:uncharacterized protein PV05_10508 [Exophiala xenobiotica]KIW51822.1 hypothetical protein PV05_10508 [Exophiala xenobiotica]